MNTRVGPFGVDVLEGLKRLRVVLGSNEFGLSFDLTWEGRSRLGDHLPLVPVAEPGSSAGKAVPHARRVLITARSGGETGTAVGGGA